MIETAVAAWALLGLVTMLANFWLGRRVQRQIVRLQILLAEAQTQRAQLEATQAYVKSLLALASSFNVHTERMLKGEGPR